MFLKSKVSSFRIAGIKLIFSFLKHLKLGFENHTQITQFSFLTYRLLQDLQFETTDFKTFFFI